MILRSSTLVAALLLLSPLAFGSVRTHRHSSAHAIVRRSTSSRSTRASGRLTEHTAAGMSSDRATQIQSALIQRGYLTGEPTGTWDSASVTAMQKMQSDNGWQTKLVPDSRALIKLGLGPNSNPATTVTPEATAAVNSPQLHQSF